MVRSDATSARTATIALTAFGVALAIAVALSNKAVEERHKHIAQRIAQLESRLSALRTQRYEEMSAAEVLDRSSAPELENVRHLLDAPPGSQGVQLEQAVRRAGSHAARLVSGRGPV